MSKNDQDLFKAVENGDLDSAKTAIAEGAHVNATNDEGLTPLLLALWNRDLDATVLLIEAGANVNASTATTALHMAVHPALLGALVVDHEIIDINAVNSDGQTALDLACMYENIDMVTILINVGASLDSAYALPTACARGCADIAVALIDAGANVNSKDTLGRSAMHLAVRCGSKVIVEKLAEAGADLSVASEFYLETPLHLALRHNLPDIAHSLIAHGADVNARNKDGFTPLDWAARHGQVQQFIDAGANIQDLAAADDLAVELPLVGASIVDSDEVA